MQRILPININKKHVFIIFLILLFSFGFFINKTVKAQELTYSKAYSDYVYNLDLYKKAHNEYEIARASYLQSRTITSQDKAEEKTALMLQARDQVLINYLTSIRTKIAETNGISDSQKESYYSQLDEEVVWYRGHKEKISTNASLQELQNTSNEAKEKYKNTEILVYKSLSIVTNGKLDSYESKLNEIVSQLEPKLAEIKSEGEKDTTGMERVVQDVKTKLSTSNDNENKAWDLLNKIKLTETDKERHYIASEKLFMQSLDLLKQANNLLMQIIENIKVK